MCFQQPVVRLPEASLAGVRGLGEDVASSN